MSTLWAPRFESYREALEAAEDLTPDDLADAMEKIDPKIRAQLALGPRPNRWACGVCEAFDAHVKRLDLSGGGCVDLDDPEWRVYLYHEVPKARMVAGDQRHYGPLANESYERTLATYRVAGWEGDAPEANA